MDPGALLAGARAALLAPFWIESPRFPTLLELESRPTSGVVPPPLRESLRASLSFLRVLARLRRFGAPWRNTCLMRSVAACLVLRRGGVGARIRLGARTGGDPSSPITAHAWVELASGAVVAEHPRGHTVLRPAGSADSPGQS